MHGRLHLLPVQPGPIDAREEWVLFHLGNSDPLAWFLRQHLLKKVPGISRNYTRYLQLCLLNALIELLNVISVERRHSNKHFVQDGAHLVDVCRLANSALREHLGRQVGRAATKGLCLVLRDAFLSEAKVRELYMPVSAD